jgi:DNA topoisomerase-2
MPRRIAVKESPRAKKSDASTRSLRAPAGKRNATTVAKSIEEKYQKMTQHQHVLAEPDNYVGSPELHEAELFIMDGGAIVSKQIRYVPALYKIYDEVLVNARDQAVRNKKCNDIRVTIKDDGWITVWNNGPGVENVMHKTEKMHVPTLIFGNLLTSGNYNQKGKTVGGKNGFGAKLANIMSKKFIFEGLDSSGTYFKQMWEDNMHKVGKPIIKKGVRGETYTKISFLPDYERLNLPRGMTSDIRALLHRRVVDIAACTNKGVKVSYNGRRVNVSDFKAYIKLHYSKPRGEDDEDGDDAASETVADQLLDEDGEPVKRKKREEVKIIYDEGPNWRVGIVYDPDHGGRQVSFVNGLNTFVGGNHVEDVRGRVVKKLMEMVLKKNKDLKLKASQIKDNISIFIDCVIEDPTFTSQIKDSLGTNVGKFSSRFEVTDDFVKKVGKSGLFDEAIAYAQMKQMEDMKKTDGRKGKGVSDIVKLEDAEQAGKRDSHKCYLILTEGDSAKASALGGLTVVGRKHFGVFPLKGKLLNVREQTMSKIAKNKEISHIKRIMGLQTGKKYTSTKELRYGGIIVMADQDHDGTHIKGLIMNFLHHFWPELIYNVPEFTIASLKTPIVKLKMGKGKDDIYFYSLQEYDAWKKKHTKGKPHPGEKYYKGLGTSTPREAREWFVNFHDKLTCYVPEVEGEKKRKKLKEGQLDSASEALHLAFNKKRADDRKKWLGAYDPETVVDHTKTKISYDEFVHKDLIHYSNSSNIRAICRLISGFKPSQSKILYTVLKRNIDSDKKEMKVAQLGGAVAENTEYHHGEQSLVGAIVNMGQDFPGSGNNINLLYPSGQFGGRMEGGKDAASGRYIFTYMEPLTKLIFRQEDTPVLYPIKDEVEPDYCPILPMLLVNGGKGIGTGYNTTVPSFNPREIMANCLLKIAGKRTRKMNPWYRSSTCTITEVEDGNYTCRANYKIEGDTIHVYDLPVGVWNTPYKARLNKLMEGKNPLVDSYVSRGNDVKGEFIIQCVKGRIRDDFGNDIEGLESKLGLITNLNTNNMHAFDATGHLKRYSTTEEIFEEFYKARMEMYVRRKKYMLDLLQREIEFLNWKIKFIEYYLDEKIVLVKKGKKNDRSDGKKKKNVHLKRSEVIAQLKKHKFPELCRPAYQDDTPSYNYLTDIRIFDLTEEEMVKLRKDHDDRRERFTKLKRTTEADLWRSDLKELQDAYDLWEREKISEYEHLSQQEALSEKNKKKGRGKGDGGAAAPTKRGRSGRAAAGGRAARGKRA